MLDKDAARAAIEAAIQSEASSSVTVDKSALQSLIREPSQSAADRLYLWLVPGLMVLIGLALVGMFLLIIDGNTATAPDLLLTAFTGLLTGLLGLFIRSPQSG